MSKVETPAAKLKRLKRKADHERWEKHFERDLKAMKIEGWTTQFKFHETRKWMFDFAFVDLKLAIEIDGGIWNEKGGHTTGVGYESDRKKDEAALLACTPSMVKAGDAIRTTEILVKMKSAKLS